MNAPVAEGTLAEASAPRAAPGPAGRLREIDELPGPRGLPFFGSVFQIRLSRVHQDVEAWCGRYGTLFKMRLGPTPILVVADHELLGAVLRDRPDGFRRSPRALEAAREMGLVGPGLFAAEGDAWRAQRRMVMASFAPRHVQSYYPAMLKVAQRLHGRWAKAARANASIDLQSDLMRYTVDAVAGLAFGAEINTLESDQEVIQRHLDKIFPALYKRAFALLPYWRWFKLPADRALETSVAAVGAAVDRFVAEARARLLADPARRERPPNLLEAMIAAADEPGSGVDDTDVAGNVLTMLLAGEDTTANTLAWLIHLLKLNPAALERANAEVRALLAPGEWPSLDQLQQLPFLDACAQETMRLKPVGPFIPVQAIRDTAIGDVRVPEGTLVWGVMRHDSVREQHFPNPTAFDPARWLDHERDKHDPQGGAGAAQRISMPFGAGARVCPGRYLALLEIKLAMAVILHRFEIAEVSTPDGLPARERMAFSMGPVGLRMRLRERG